MGRKVLTSVVPVCLLLVCAGGATAAAFLDEGSRTVVVPVDATPPHPEPADVDRPKGAPLRDSVSGLRQPTQSDDRLPDFAAQSIRGLEPEAVTDEARRVEPAGGEAFYLVPAGSKVCLVSPQGNGTCSTDSSIRGGRAIMSISGTGGFAPPSSPGPTTVAGMVPDGISHVVVTTDAGKAQRTPVVGNVFSARIDAPADEVSWRTDAGEEIATKVP